MKQLPWPRGITARVAQLEREIARMSQDQQHLDAQVNALRDAANQQNNTIIAIQSEIDQLKAAAANGQPLDFAGLDAAVATLQGTTSQLEGIVTAGTTGTIPGQPSQLHQALAAQTDIPAEAHQQLGEPEPAAGGQQGGEGNDGEPVPVPNQPADEQGVPAADGTPSNVTNQVPTAHGSDAPAGNAAPQQPQGPAKA